MTILMWGEYEDYKKTHWVFGWVYILIGGEFSKAQGPNPIIPVILKFVNLPSLLHMTHIDIY
jgi:hypothetical protein